MDVRIVRKSWDKMKQMKGKTRVPLPSGYLSDYLVTLLLLLQLWITLVFCFFLVLAIWAAILDAIGCRN